jgi:uncharacterized protein (TIGR02996 family)
MLPALRSLPWPFALGTLLLVACSVARSAPYVPADDDTPLEQAPSTLNAALRDKAARLAQHPQDAQLAVEVAAGWLQIARRTSDPRPIGYAEAALKPWWRAAAPPPEVLFQRASLKQTVHQFEAALADLSLLLTMPGLPRSVHAQALLTRATVLAVVGRQIEAARDCIPLSEVADRNIGRLCTAQVQALGAQAARTSDLLGFLLEHGGLGSDATTRLWGDTLTGELAARLGRTALAQEAFTAALKEDPEDAYLLAAYADFLLDQGRPGEVRSLLASSLRADGLLLRHALALKALRDPQAANEAAQLGARFAAARARGDQTHKREESRYVLQLRGDAATALKLALENWDIQREPADVRVLAEAAVATHDAGALRIVHDWIASTGLIDAVDPAVRQVASNG